MDGHSDILFEKQVPLTLKQSLLSNTNSISSGVQDQFHEKKQASITVKVALSSKNNGRIKVLEIQLTDETDPFFLYHLNIGEDDFHALKSEQNLLVDFQHFPVKFIELLEECTACKGEELPKFLGQLITDNPTTKYPVFSVIETNSFKHINHLSLNFIPGNDAAVKTYLASLVKEFKHELSRLRENLQTTTSSLTTRLGSAEDQAHKYSTELEQLKSSTSAQIAQLKLKNSEEMGREREKMMRQFESERRGSEKEKRDIEVKYEEEMKSLNQKYTAVNTTHSHLLSHTQTLESTVATSTKQIETLTRDLNSTRQEVQRLQHNNQQIERKNYEQEKECLSLQEQLREMEKRMQEKEEMSRKANDLLDGANAQKLKVEDALHAYKTQNVLLEESVKKASDEINKGNDIIRRLQTELKNSKSKIKLKNAVTLQQEKLLDERSVTIETVNKELANAKEALLKKQEELDSITFKSNEANKKLDESKQIIEDNNHVIEWLHKQLNEEALSRPVPGSGTGYGAIDFDKYARATPNSVAERKSPSNYRKYASTSENEAPQPITSLPQPAKYQYRPPNTGPTVRTSPNRVVRHSNSSPSFNNPAQSKLSASNMATGASHISGTNVPNPNRSINGIGVARFPLKNVTANGKSNYFTLNH